MAIAAAAPGGTLRDHGYHRLRVKQVVQETADTMSYVLDVPVELRDAFAYRAGQFCTFRVDEQLRCYSMSSAPETDPDLTVTVKRVPGGLVSNWFHDAVAAGDLLECTRPAGVFCLRDSDTHTERPVVAFCGGSGITPVLGIAKSALTSSARSVALLYANRDAGSVIFATELERLAAESSGRLVVTHHLDDRAGFLTAADVEAFAAPHLADADFYLCGPTPFMELVETALLDLGVDSDRILVERFGAAAEQHHLPAAPVPDDDQAPATVTLVLKGQSHEVTYVRGDTVLETARRAGLQPPYSCEAGNCATCMAVLRDGSATMRANNALTDDEVAEGWVLTCQALLSGPSATVEYESL